MFSLIPEKNIRIVRWILAIAWLLLIASLFYDPFSAQLTAHDNLTSPFSNPFIAPEVATDPNLCIAVQGKCLEEEPYQIGARLFWGMAVPTAVIFVLTFGHEAWRRICPLYFMSQIPRSLGMQPKLDIEENTWLIKNHLYLQFGFFFVGLCARLLFVNSDRIFLACFLLATILSAITMVFVYGGRTWCHYVCPFGMVQLVFTGPRGLLGSEAHTQPKGSITQSKCRTINSQGQEESACITCRKPCMDIDAEGSYWGEIIAKPGRKLVQYGYVGMVVGYFLYYGLYAGDFNYYFSGAWAHEPNQLGNLFKPGFYILDRAIPIPKIVAVPMTFAAFTGIAYLIWRGIEKVAVSAVLGKNISASDAQKQALKETAVHRVFSAATFFAFNFFFIYGGRPELLRFPLPVQLGFQGIVFMVSSIWLYRTWSRTSQQYKLESQGAKLLRELKKLEKNLGGFSRYLGGRSLDDLKPSELELLYNVLPNVTKQDRLQAYKGILQDALDVRNVTPASSLEALRQLRQKMQLGDEEHFKILEELGHEAPELFAIASSQPPVEAWGPPDGVTRIQRRPGPGVASREEMSLGDTTAVPLQRISQIDSDRTQPGRSDSTASTGSDRTQVKRPGSAASTDSDRTQVGRPGSAASTDSDRTQVKRSGSATPDSDRTQVERPGSATPDSDRTADTTQPDRSDSTASTGSDRTEVKRPPNSTSANDSDTTK